MEFVTKHAVCRVRRETWIDEWRRRKCVHKKGRVEDRRTPALPHQTVHAVFREKKGTDLFVLHFLQLSDLENKSDPWSCIEEIVCS